MAGEKVLWSKADLGYCVMIDGKLKREKSKRSFKGEDVREVQQSEARDSVGGV
jgi:hypothetical protein